MPEFDIKLSAQMLDVIGEGLMLVPYGKAAPVINEINKQIAAKKEENDKTGTDA